MHAHLEIVMPPVEAVQAAVEDVLDPFCEHGEDPNPNAFWDFYVIGGRWSGAKLQAKVGEERLQQFREFLSEQRVTVSGFQCGKQSLSPTNQIPQVDQWWREWFPDSGIDVCPLFAHSNDQYSSDDTLPLDIARLEDVPREMSCERVIFAAPSVIDGRMEAQDMFQDQVWNGVTHLDTVWDGTIRSALAWLEERLPRYREEFAESLRPKSDSLVVTVDYHS